MKSVVSELVSWMDVPSGLGGDGGGPENSAVGGRSTSFFPAARRHGSKLLRVARALGDRPNQIRRSRLARTNSTLYPDGDSGEEACLSVPMAILGVFPPRRCLSERRC